MTKKETEELITNGSNIYLTKLCKALHVRLLSLRFKTELHLTETVQTGLPLTGQITNQMEMATRVTNQITEVDRATSGHSLDTPLTILKPSEEKS